MSYSLVWLPEILKRAGLKVSEVPGWHNRGWRADMGRIFGVICHHTGVNNRRKNMPTLGSLINGRAAEPNKNLKAIPGPLAHLGLGRDGTYYIIAAGVANHAGPGKFKNENWSGNSNFIGIEAENTGLPNDSPWPEVQIKAYRHGVAAILKHIGQGSEYCLGHKEWRAEKPDPGFDMNQFRASVAAILDGTVPAPVLIPPVEPLTQPGGPTRRPTLRRGMTGPLTKQVQAKVGVPPDGNFGPKTEAAVRAFQRLHDLVPDGIVGPKTWLTLDAA